MLELTQVRLPNSDQSFDHRFTSGEICVVLGANLAGKTDLCRLIAGLPTRATGQVTLDGQDLAALPIRNRPVAMVYQAFINYPNLTVAENIASPMRARRQGREEIEAQVAELAAKLQIQDLLQRLPAELSGGQQQRLAIARALAKQARVLLLDEPLVNLDFKLREALEAELRTLLQASDTVVLYTASDPRDAFTLGDQVLLLDAGDKLQAGPPMDVYTTPANLPALQLLSDPRANLCTLDSQLSAIRPEHLRLDASADHQFTLTVTASETNGDETFVHGRLHTPDDHADDNQDWVVRTPGMPDITVGGDITISARHQDVHTFGAAG